MVGGDVKLYLPIHSFPFFNYVPNPLNQKIRSTPNRARAEEIGVEAVVITRSPHKFKNVKPTTTVIEVQLDEEDKLKEAFPGCNGITWILTRPVRPTKTPFVGAYAHKDKRGPMNCSIFDQGDFCLYCVASSQWDMLAPHVSSGPQPKEK